MGTPTIAIVLAIGRTLGDACEMRSAVIAVTAPVRREAGIIVLWTDVLKTPLAMCGATIPTKPSGPQNAVTVAARRLQLNNALSRIFLTGAPDISAKIRDQKAVEDQITTLFAELPEKRRIEKPIFQ